MLRLWIGVEFRSSFIEGTPCLLRSKLGHALRLPLRLLVCDNRTDAMSSVYVVCIHINSHLLAAVLNFFDNVHFILPYTPPTLLLCWGRKSIDANGIASFVLFEIVMCLLKKFNFVGQLLDRLIFQLICFLKHCYPSGLIVESLNQISNVLRLC